MTLVLRYHSSLFLNSDTLKPEPISPERCEQHNEDGLLLHRTILEGGDEAVWRGTGDWLNHLYQQHKPIFSNMLHLQASKDLQAGHKVSFSGTTAERLTFSSYGRLLSYIVCDGGNTLGAINAWGQRGVYGGGREMWGILMWGSWRMSDRTHTVFNRVVCDTDVGLSAKLEISFT